MGTGKDLSSLSLKQRKRSLKDIKNIRNIRLKNKSRPTTSIIQFMKDRTLSIKGLFILPAISNIKIPTVLLDSKKKNWTTNSESYFKSHIATINCGRYSSRSPWTRFEYRRVYESWGVRISKKHCFFQFDTDKGIVRRIVKAPKGWKWKIDNNGLFIQGPKGQDYHPSRDDFVTNQKNFNLLKVLRDKANQNYKTRKENEKKQKEEKSFIKIAVKENIPIRIKDSVEAGNCMAGSLNWAKKHGINRNWANAKEIINDLKNEGNRGLIVVAKALQRYKQDMKRGYCVV